MFRPDIEDIFKNLIKKYGIDPAYLELEITESVYSESLDQIISTVNNLRDIGFSIQMDDFGSGYSSLIMISRMKLDVLKLDMRFLHIEQQEEEKGIGILESVVNMARQMQLPIIVEGVETQKQESFLLKMGCRYSQGYYYYRPMPVTQLEKVFNEDNGGV
jgi:EAL domain-containing protein (putative c-di-GMP-specific phosphodiesterase class I)